MIGKTKGSVREHVHCPIDERRSRRRLHGFTLIELLVVVAVIAVLIAILLPALGLSRELAKQVVCLTQTRQFGQVMLLYASDNGDHFPAARWDNHGQPSVPNTWYSNMTPWLDPGKRWERQVSGLSVTEAMKYNEMWERLTCPAQALAGIYIVQGVHRTYGHNLGHSRDTAELTYAGGRGLTNWGGEGETRRLTELADPSRTMAFMDTRNVDYIYPQFYQWCVSPEGQSAGGLANYLPVRHPSGYAGTFADGHGRMIPEAEVADPYGLLWIARY